MCGIAGILTFNGQQVLTSQLKKMGDILSHRGPDGEGFWLNASLSMGMAHRRLSIIDLSERAAQPMHYLNRYSIVFNGEIYNYIELRNELKKYGYSFTTESDTEVLLAAFDKYGVKMPEYLDGMFSIAIWDEQERKLFCVRDRFGEKPFYFYHKNNERFVFASEMKALFGIGIEKRHNRHMVYNFLAHHIEENPFDRTETFFENVFSLEPAHYLLIDHDGVVIKEEYWRLEIKRDESITFDEAASKFRELFDLSIKRRLRSDVPVGSSLSGGIDSSAVVCSLFKFNEQKAFSQNTFSARFYDPSKDEGSYMKMVIDSTAVTPHEVWIDERVLVDDLDKICYYQEEPFGSASILAQWKVMQLAKDENVTVLLDGQGADEVMGGYVHFFRPYFMELYLHNSKLLHKELASYKELRGKDFDINLRFKLDTLFPNLMQFSGAIKRKIINPSYFKFISKHLLHLYKNEPQPFTQFRTLNESLLHATTEYGLDRLLRFADRNAMAHSREVRLPFLFHELVEFMFTLPSSYKIKDGWTKYILRKSVENRLPMEIAWRVAKLGYEVPQDKWMEHLHVAERLRISKEYLVKEDYLEPQFAHLADNWMCLVASSFLRNS